MASTPQKKLHACLRKDTEEIFYASMIETKGVMAEMRSSHEVEIGLALVMIAVPENWNGAKHSPNDILQSPQAMGANVIRKEGRGSFHVRLLSFEEQDITNRIRAGSISEDKLYIETSAAGMIYSVSLQGRIAMESAANLKSSLTSIPKEYALILLDLTELTYFAKNGMGLFIVALKETLQQGRNINILAKKDSQIEIMLRESKVSTLAEIHTDRDEAVASLIRHTFT